MSRSEADERIPGFGSLEEAVGRALQRISELEEALARTTARRDEMEGLLRRMTTGEESPALMARRLDELDHENQDLRGRLRSGLEATDRLMARVRYLEDHG